MGETVDEKPRRAWPALYATLWLILVDVGRDHGYAMGLHGSLARDLDVIAAPWSPDASDAETLVSAIAERTGAFRDEDFDREPAKKPHGRLTWSLILGAGAFIDLSVMPLAAETAGEVRDG